MVAAVFVFFFFFVTNTKTKTTTTITAMTTAAHTTHTRTMREISGPCSVPDVTPDESSAAAAMVTGAEGSGAEVTGGKVVAEVGAEVTGAEVTTAVVVYEVTASAVTSVVETHEMVTAPAAGLAARLEVMSNEVAPTAIGAPTVVMVRTFPTDAAVCAPLDGVAATATAASAVKMALSYVHVIVLPTASSVVMPRASAFEVGVSPATRVLSVDVPVVSAAVDACVAW